MMSERTLEATNILRRINALDLIKHASITALGALLLGCATNEVASDAPSMRTSVANQADQTSDAPARIIALNPLCDLAVLPRPNTELDDRKEIIEAAYVEDVENPATEGKSVTVTIDLWGRPAAGSTDATLTRRLIVKESGFFSFREWTSYEFELMPKGNDPFRLVIEGLDGENGCEVSLIQPGIVNGQAVRWRSGNRADLDVVEATSRTDVRATDTQVKAAEGTAAGLRRDVLRVRSNGETIDIYILGPEP